jgi:signal peptidase II
MVARKYLILVSMTGMLVSLDQLTKFLITNAMELRESVPVISGFFNLTLIHNRGAAFGLFSDLPASVHTPFFLLVPAATLAVIIYVFSRLKEEQQLSIYALSLIVGGAFGNLMDRLRLGYVVDFLDFHWRAVHFPAFNLADSVISLGVLLLFLSILFEKESREP